MTRWPTRHDLEHTPNLGRAKPSFGRGTIRSWDGAWYFLPDAGQPIIRIGGGFDAAAVLPARLLHGSAQLQLLGSVA